MTIAFDATANGSHGAGTTLTYTHTSTGSNLILWVTIDIDTTTDDVTGVTYNGVAMTQINTTIVGAGALRRCYLYYLLNPATGANNIVVSRTNSGVIRSASASYTGALQSGVPDAQNTTNATAASTITLSTTTIADNCWVVSGHNNDQGGPTAGAGLTIRGTYTNGGIGDNNAAKTPAGAVSLTWNLPSSGASAICQASFAPATGTTTSTSSSTSTSTTSTSSSTSTSTTSTSSSTSTTSTSSSTSRTTSTSSSTSTSTTSTSSSTSSTSTSTSKTTTSTSMTSTSTSSSSSSSSSSSTSLTKEFSFSIDHGDK